MQLMKLSLLIWLFFFNFFPVPWSGEILMSFFPIVILIPLNLFNNLKGMSAWS
jgi:hypothetical protein